MTELPERFLPKVVVDAATGCWQWQATIAHNGYGHFVRRTRDRRRAA